MKATLSFNLPEEEAEFELASKARDYAIAIEEIGNFLRHKLKYEELSEVEAKIYNEIREKFFEFTANLPDV